MSLVKLSHFSKETLTAKLESQISNLAQRNTHRKYSFSDSSNFLLAFCGEELIGFLEVKFNGDVALIKNIVVPSHGSLRNIDLKLLTASLQTSLKHECHRIQLACQQSHISLFEKAGFFVTEAPHHGERNQFYIMENPSPKFYLDTLKKHPRSSTITEQSCDLLIIGEDSETHNFHEESQYVELHHRMMAQARKQVWILCDNISNPVLNSEYTSKCLLRLVKRNPHSEIRILVANDKMGAGYYNPTINLAQRLSSYIEVRTLSKTGLPFKDMISLVDFTSCIYRRNVSSTAGFANFNNPLMAQRLRHNFEHHWSFARQSLHLRRLAI